MRISRSLIRLIFGNTGARIYDEITQNKCKHTNKVMEYVCLDCDAVFDADGVTPL